MMGRTCSALIIKFGTWKGASAIAVAEAVGQEKSDTKILCIDPFAQDYRLPVRHCHDRLVLVS